jgi:hypothetical protein
MKKNDRQFGFQIRRSHYQGAQRVEVCACMRDDEHDYPLGVSSWYDFERPKHLQGLELDHLGMFGWISDPTDYREYRDGDTFDYIGCEPAFGQPYRVNLDEAERMVRTLKRIAKASQGENEAGDRLMAMAKALKAEFIATAYDRDGKVHWSFNDLATGRNRYRELIREAQDDVRKRAQAKAARQAA